MPVSDAERLRAAGHVVTLAAGDFPLIYDFGGLLLLEQDLGSLNAIGSAVQRWVKAGKGGGVKLSELRAFMVAGLAHVPLTASEVVGGMLLSNLQAYQLAVLAAIDEAFPAPGKDGQGNGQSGEATGSNGTSSTSSPQSDTAVPVTTSGA